MTLLWLALFGALGATLRFLIDGLMRARSTSPVPWGTVMVNVLGSFALGLLTGLALWHELSDEWLTILGTGLCGGLTTFSTASFETVRLMQQRRYGAAALSSVGMLLASVVAAAAGLAFAG